MFSYTIKRSQEKKIQSHSGNCTGKQWSDQGTSSVISYQILDDIKLKFEECNYIKYAASRVALKFKVLQNICSLQSVPLALIEAVFERHKLKSNEGCLNLEPLELEAVLFDIYYAAIKQNYAQVDVDDVAEQMVYLMQNIFNRNGDVNVQVISAKLILAILCKCTLRELYSFLFNLCADHNSCVTRLRLQNLLVRVVSILMFIHEDVAYGQHLVNASVDDCFSKSPGLVGINESSFMIWLEKNPKILSWLPELDKVKNSNMVVHSLKCSSCKVTPLIGLVYKCKKCGNYKQCQHCFFTGKETQNHKATHKMKEITAEKYSRGGFSVLKRMTRLFKCSMQKSEDVSHHTKSDMLKNSCKHFIKHLGENIGDIGHLSFHQQLQVIIQQLELQNNHLQMFIKANHNDSEVLKYIEDYRTQIAIQVHRLRTLKSTLALTETNNDIYIENKEVKFENQNIRGMLNMATQTTRREDPDDCLEHSRRYSLQGRDDWNEVQMPVEKTICGEPENQAYMRQIQVRKLHSNLDEALAKLQQILAANITLDDTVALDNGQLKYAVSEVEDMLSTFIDSVECSKANSVLSSRT